MIVPFLLFLPFIMIPSAAGSIVILLVTRFMHRRMFKWGLFRSNFSLPMSFSLFL